MSTQPGNDALRDAGLTSPDLDGAVNLTEELETQLAAESVAATGPDARTADVPHEDYAPGTPRPDQRGAADEADVVEQAAVVPEDDEYV